MSSIARRSLHTTAPTSRMTRANHVSVMSWTVAPTYTCSRASSGRTCLERADQPQHRVRGPPGLVGDEVEVELICTGMGGDLRRRLGGDDAQSRLGCGQRGEDVQPGLQSRAFLEDLRQLGRAPQVGVLLGVAQTGAHVGSHSCGQGRQRLGDLGQRGPPRHDHTTVVDLDVGLEQATLGQDRARCRRSAFVGRCRPARHARRRTTRGSAVTSHSR